MRGRTKPTRPLGPKCLRKVYRTPATTAAVEITNTGNASNAAAVHAKYVTRLGKLRSSGFIRSASSDLRASYLGEGQDLEEEG